MFKFVVDASPLLSPLSGVGWYLLKLLQSLESLQQEEDFDLGVSLYSNFTKMATRKAAIAQYLQKSTHIYGLPLPGKLVRALTQLPAPRWGFYDAWMGNPDLYHGTNYDVLPCKKSRTVLNIYDLSFIRYPQFTNAVVNTFATQVRRCLQWTDLVLTISESSKQDIVQYLQVDPARIQVTPLASRYPSGYMPPKPAAIPPQLTQPYILFVSTIEPRKNVAALIEAFNLLKKREGLPHHLVLIGQKGWLYEPIFEALACSPYAQEIHHLDYLPDATLAWAYAQADVFAYPSHYEGFGLPVLEAMTLGTPVVTANTSSLPEVAGDAALLVAPDDPDAIAIALTQVLTQPNLREQLIARGKERVQHYSWSKTARLTLHAYRSLLP